MSTGNDDTATATAKIDGVEVSVRIRPDDAYTTTRLAAVLGVPEYAIRDRVRDGRLNGKKIGQYFFVSGREFLAFLDRGFSYSPRPSRRRRSLSEDVAAAYERETKRVMRSSG